MADVRVLELFSGIGGFHCAFRDSGIPGNVVAAVDINTTANETYRLNFPETKLWQRNIQSLTVDEIDHLNVDFIWMSPPCQPFTRVGKKKDCQDTRTSPFLYILSLLSRLKVKPKYIGLENVKGFETSDARDAFLSVLKENGYTFQEFLLTPLQFGIPNSRLRYYTIAKLKPATFPFLLTDHVMVDFPRNDVVEVLPLGHFLESSAWSSSGDHLLTDNVLLKYGLILDVVNADSKNSCCFTKAYGHYMEGTGSVLHENVDVALNDAYRLFSMASEDEHKLNCLRQLKLRYFTAKEIGRILGFPENFDFAETATRQQQYRLLGNSLSVKVVTKILDLFLGPQQ